MFHSSYAADEFCFDLLFEHDLVNNVTLFIFLI